MQGRYGIDNLSRFLIWVFVGIVIISFFIQIPLSGLLRLAILVVFYFRTFSKNIPARYAENEKFLHLKDRFTSFFRNFKSNMSQMKDYHIYKCPQCNQKIRIPRGKGHIMVRCPSCGFEFHKKS